MPERSNGAGLGPAGLVPSWVRILLPAFQTHMKPVHITYFVHGTTVDNEAEIASGGSDCELSPLGIAQSRRLGGLIKDRKFDAVFCSDLKRAVDSAKLMFGETVPILKDRRLKECDYGDLEI